MIANAHVSGRYVGTKDGLTSIYGRLKLIDDVNVNERKQIEEQ